jgi:hypothetical protein
MKYLFKFMNKHDTPWVNLIWRAHYVNGKIPQSSNACGSFWWRDCLSLLGKFLLISSCNAGPRNTVRFWMDAWEDISLREQFPQLFSFALDNDITLERFTHHCRLNEIDNIFYLPLSLPAVQQFEELSMLVLNRDTPNATDSWILSDCKKTYSSRRVYQILAPSEPAPKPMLWIWKSCVLPKIKIFFWLLLQDRLNTRELLSRKNFQIPSLLCALCDDANIEDFIHLFFACDFSQRFWWNLNIEWNTELPIMDLLMDGKRRHDFSCFKEILLTGCWTLWNQRNRIIFDGEQCAMQYSLHFFKDLFSLIRHRAKPSLKEGMSQWLDTL